MKRLILMLMVLILFPSVGCTPDSYQKGFSEGYEKGRQAGLAEVEPIRQGEVQKESLNEITKSASTNQTEEKSETKSTTRFEISSNESEQEHETVSAPVTTIPSNSTSPSSYIFPPPISIDYLAESAHPYPITDVDVWKTWEITKPGAGQIRVHFKKIALAFGSSILMRGGFGSWGLPTDTMNYWSTWVPGDTAQISINSNPYYSKGDEWGFLVDKIEIYTPGQHVTVPFVKFQTEHPYSNNSELIFRQDGLTQIKFAEIELAYGDQIIIVSNDGKQQVITPGVYRDLWSETFPDGIYEVRLVSDGEFTAWGFLVYDRP